MGAAMNSTLKKSFLIVSFLTIGTVAVGYGVSPSWFASSFLGVAELDRNFAHILRAVMCLYLAFGAFWLVGAFNQQYRNVALLTVMILSGGLLIGRIISFFVDGTPALLLQIYAGIELLVLPVAYWIFRLPEQE